jgi:hypothetical protein
MFLVTDWRHTLKTTLALLIALLVAFPVATQAGEAIDVTCHIDRLLDPDGNFHQNVDLHNRILLEHQDGILQRYIFPFECLPSDISDYDISEDRITATCTGDNSIGNWYRNRFTINRYTGDYFQEQAVSRPDLVVKSYGRCVTSSRKF